MMTSRAMMMKCENSGVFHIDGTYKLIKLASEMGIDFNPDYLMMDSSDATYNAASTIFPNETILMCYFHMMQNVLKNCRSLFKTEEGFNGFLDTIYDIHISKSNLEYHERLNTFKVNIIFINCYPFFLIKYSLIIFRKNMTIK